MDLLNSALGALKGGPEGSGGSLLENVLALVQNKESGGLQGLVKSLSDNGLGDAVASWVGTGSNLPVSGDALAKALGPERVQAMAQAAGVSVPEASGQLASMLPQLIDSLTPGGTVPEDGLLAKGIALARSRLG